MSAPKVYEEKDFMVRPDGPWGSAWKIAAGIAVLGIALVAVVAFNDRARFAFSYLFAFFTFLTIGLGSLFFVLVQRLVGAHWSVTVRRTAEFLVSGIPAFAVLFVPILLSFPVLCPMLAPERTGGQHAMLAAVEGQAFAQQAEGQEIAPAASAAAAPSAQPVAPAAPAAGEAKAAEAPAAEGHAAAKAEGHEPTKADEHAAPAEGHAAPAAAPTDHPAPGVGHAAHGEAGDQDEHAAARHGEHGDHGAHDPHHVLHEETLAKKAAWFQPGFFYGRAIFYVASWVFLAWLFFGWSTKEDKARGFAFTLKAQKFAPLSTMLFAITLTFAAFDWIMALEPSWFSTIFGLYVFATAFVSALAVITVITLSLRTSYLKDVVTVEHFHDLGKLMFGFNVFWAYIAFSQFMLIWYAGLPEETTYYHTRWNGGPWAFVSILIVFGHFILPLFLLLSRNVKRDLPKLRVGAFIILCFHAVEWYWLVMPNLLPVDYSFDVLADVGALLAVGGSYFAVVFYRMTKHALIPVGDPRLERSVHFQNA